MTQHRHEAFFPTGSLYRAIAFHLHHLTISMEQYSLLDVFILPDEEESCGGMRMHERPGKEKTRSVSGFYVWRRSVAVQNHNSRERVANKECEGIHFGLYLEVLSLYIHHCGWSHI
ncbi:hypothetical protein P4H66_15570 [Paenibacillus dokdonensis]|uniref:Uncharacterized protein n=1 Tax=Paenibacillus dokdonensis TaxID=2567944 RepID=A0ABU6GRC3_9BACL|nr:hypothetical protein [Paenibacillus dokdonensis]MEC0241270.1 hypothetical protein [Paenibacillus dokdonensis]